MNIGKKNLLHVDARLLIILHSSESFCSRWSWKLKKIIVKMVVELIKQAQGQFSVALLVHLPFVKQ